MQITITDKLKDEITSVNLKDYASMCAEEITELLDELQGGSLEQYKLKDLNDSVANLAALMVVIRYCTVKPQLDYYEEILAEYCDAVHS